MKKGRLYKTRARGPNQVLKKNCENFFSVNQKIQYMYVCKYKKYARAHVLNAVQIQNPFSENWIANQSLGVRATINKKQQFLQRQNYWEIF